MLAALPECLQPLVWGYVDVDGHMGVVYWAVRRDQVQVFDLFGGAAISSWRSVLDHAATHDAAKCFAHAWERLYPREAEPVHLALLVSADPRCLGDVRYAAPLRTLLALSRCRCTLLVPWTNTTYELEQALRAMCSLPPHFWMRTPQTAPPPVDCEIVFATNKGKPLGAASLYGHFAANALQDSVELAVTVNFQYIPVQ